MAASLAGVVQSAHAAITAGSSLYVDFGKNDTTNGIAMGSPDSNGHYWNNAIHAFNQPGGAGFGTNPAVTPLTNMVNSSNVATGVGMNFSNGWQANGFLNGGLTTPSSALLGDFAFANVTGDYFFFDTSGGSPATCTITLTGLDTSLTYNFSIFATRNTTEVRTTSYSIVDINGPHSTNLPTSGAGIGNGGYNGNNNTLASFTGIVPTAGGEITLTVDNAASNFAYIGALRLDAVPEPSVALLSAVGVLGLLRRRRA